MKRHFCFIIVALTLLACGAVAQPCKIEHRKLDQKALQNLQVAKVNSYKEPWRLDAKKVTQREISGLAKTQYSSPDAVPVNSVKGDDKTQVFSYVERGTNYQIILKKPEWLLPYAGTYGTMMWVVTDIKTNCAK